MTTDHVNEQLVARILRSSGEVSDHAQRQEFSLRNAAKCLAVQRVATAHLTRGLTP